MLSKTECCGGIIPCSSRIDPTSVTMATVKVGIGASSRRGNASRLTHIVAASPALMPPLISISRLSPTWMACTQLQALTAVYIEQHRHKFPICRMGSHAKARARVAHYAIVIHQCIQQCCQRQRSEWGNITRSAGKGYTVPLLPETDMMWKLCLVCVAVVHLQCTNFHMPTRQHECTL